VNFDPEVFISYAHLDDEAGWRGHKWITEFHHALEIRVSQLLGRQPEIWRDPNLHGNDPLTDTLVNRVRCAAALISIISPRYLRSDWTRRELQEFCLAASANIRLKNKSRLFKVVKTPVPLTEEIPPLPELLGYEFFKHDPTVGHAREFDDPNEKEYWVKIDDVAHDLCQLLKMVGESGIDQIKPAKTIYLAETTADLADEYAALKRDLQQHGYAVLPSRPLPLIDKDLRESVRSDLAQSDMSVHLIGKRYSLIPEAGTLSLAEVQHELALERAEEGTLIRLVWIPPGLQFESEKQKAFAATLRLNPRAQHSGDLLETEFEDLRSVIHERLKEKPVEPKKTPAGQKQIYFIFDRQDMEIVNPWRDFLFEHFEIVYPEFEADEARIREVHEENLRTSDAVLILYAAGTEIWLRRKLRELQKVAGYGRTQPFAAVAVVVAPPLSASKRLFNTHEATVISQAEGFSPGPFLPFVERVKAP
jgi:hypothetical protein